jgi:hypothetical protein
MTPESLRGNKDMIHVDSIYKQIRMTHYDFFGGVTLKLSVITPLIQNVIKECLTLGLFDRVSRSPSFPHSYVATKKGMRLDTTDIFPYNLVRTLSDLQQSTWRSMSGERPASSASSSSFKSTSCSSSRENGNGVNSAIGTESSSPVDLGGCSLSARLLIDKGREGDRERDTTRDKEGSREGNTTRDKEGSNERDRLAVANVSSFDRIAAKKGMDIEVEEDIVTEIVWADQDPGEEQRPLTPERNRSDKGDKLKNKKDSNHGPASGKSSDESREKKVVPSTSSDPSKKSWPTFLKLGSVVVERSPYSHLCGALGCRIIFEAMRVRPFLSPADISGSISDPFCVHVLASLPVSVSFSTSTASSLAQFYIGCNLFSYQFPNANFILRCCSWFLVLLNYRFFKTAICASASSNLSLDNFFHRASSPHVTSPFVAATRTRLISGHLFEQRLTWR